MFEARSSEWVRRVGRDGFSFFQNWAGLVGAQNVSQFKPSPLKPGILLVVAAVFIGLCVIWLLPKSLNQFTNSASKAVSSPSQTPICSTSLLLSYRYISKTRACACFISSGLWRPCGSILVQGESTPLWSGRRLKTLWSKPSLRKFAY